MPKEMWLHIRVRDYRRCWPLDWKELFRSRQHDVQRESLACHGAGIRAEDRRFSTRAGESRRLQLQGRARHRRATRHLHQIRGTQKFEVHRPLWPESWRHANVSGGESETRSSSTQTQANSFPSESTTIKQALWNRCKGSRGRRWRRRASTSVVVVSFEPHRAI